MNKRSFLKRSIIGTAAIMLAPEVSCLEYYPAQSIKKWAVLYSTWCGSARDASLWISEGMDGIANVFDVRENPDLSSYDHVVIGGAIRSGAVSPDLVTYIERNQGMLKNKIRGLFAVCGNMMQPVGPPQVKSLIDDHLALICGVTGLPSRVFSGRVTFGLMEPEVKKQMQSMPGMKEYDNLKRPECMAFGKEVMQANA